MAGEQPGNLPKNFRLEADPAPETPESPLREGGSLASYIAERLHAIQAGNEEGALFDVQPESGAMRLPEPGMPLPEAFNPFNTQAPRQAGYRLNQTDRELISGLEPLLPTAGIRLRVMRNRLTQEIATLESRLNKYYKLEGASPAFQTRITLLENRLVMLKHQEHRVNGYMNQLFANGAFLFRLEDVALVMQFSWERWLGGVWRPFVEYVIQGMGRLFRRPALARRQAVRQLNAELAELQSLLQECLDSPVRQSGELDVLLARYDQKARQLSTLLSDPTS